MATVYPAQIDTSITISTAVNNTTIVGAASVNNIRDAVLAVENALGINPASIYGNVATRLTTIETDLASIIDAGSFVAGGDLTGNSVSQTVSKIQGTLVTVSSPQLGDYIYYNGAKLVNGSLGSLKIEWFSPSTSDLGAAIQTAHNFLPAENGGIIDATGLKGNWTWNTQVNINRPIKIIFDSINITSTVQSMFTVQNNFTISGTDGYATQIFPKSAGYLITFVEPYLNPLATFKYGINYFILERLGVTGGATVVNTVGFTGLFEADILIQDCVFTNTTNFALIFNSSFYYSRVFRCLFAGCFGSAQVFDDTETLFRDNIHEVGAFGGQNILLINPDFVNIEQDRFFGEPPNVNPDVEIQIEDSFSWTGGYVNIRNAHFRGEREEWLSQNRVRIRSSSTSLTSALNGSVYVNIDGCWFLGPGALTIASIGRSSGTVTATITCNVSQGHGLQVGDQVQVVTGMSDSSFLGTFTVTAVGSPGVAQTVSWAQSGSNSSQSNKGGLLVSMETAAIRFEAPIGRWTIENNNFESYAFAVDDDQPITLTAGNGAVNRDISDRSLFTNNTITGSIGYQSQEFKLGGRFFSTVEVNEDSPLVGFNSTPNNKEKPFLQNRIARSENQSLWDVVGACSVGTGATDPYGTTRACHISRTGVTPFCSTGGGVTEGIQLGIDLTSLPAQSFIKFWAKGGTATNLCSLNVLADVNSVFQQILFRTISLSQNWKQYKIPVVWPTGTSSAFLGFAPGSVDAMVADNYVFAFQVCDQDCDYVTTTSSSYNDTTFGSMFQKPLAFNSGISIGSGGIAANVPDPSNLFLTEAQSYSPFIDITGTLTALRFVILNQIVDGQTWLIRNSTTGGFPIILAGGSGQSASIYPGVTRQIFSDGVSVFDTSADPGGQATNTLVNGLNSNISTSGLPTLRFSGPTAAFSIGGFSPAPSPGTLLLVINTTSEAMTIVNEDASSTSACRIATQSASSVTPPPVGPNGSATFLYDGTINRWILQNIGVSNPVYINVKDYGALGNGMTTAADGHVTSGLTAFTSASAAGAGGPAFSLSDVGKTIVIPGAGVSGAVLRTTIAAYVSAGAVTLAAPASTTVTTARTYWYTDDTTAIQEAVDAAISFGFAGVAFPPSIGGYVCTSTVSIPNSMMLIGTGGKVAGGISGGYTNAPAIWHDFSGNLFVFNGAGGSGSSVWGKATSGGGVRDLRITQVYGSPSDGIPSGYAIQIVVTSSLESPSWMQLEDLNIEEGYNSPWTYAMVLDGSAIAGSGGLPNCRISKVSSHTGAGALGALLLMCCSSTKVTDCEFHDVNGHISITGTSSGRSVGISVIGGDCVNIELDYASQVSITGIQANAITTTSNTLGPNFILPGQLTTPFGPDNSSGSGTTCLWPDPIGQVNPCVHSSVAVCLTSGEYFSCSHSQTGGSNLVVTGCVNDGGIFEITTAGAHGLSTGAQVRVAGILGFTGGTGPNGSFLITYIDSTHFTLQSSVYSSGSYSSGGIITPTMCSLVGLQSVGGIDEAWVVPNADVPLRVSSTGGTIGFLGAAPIARPTITGTTMAGSGIVSTITELVALGLVTDGTTGDQITASGTSISVANGVRVVFKNDDTSLANLTGGVAGQIVTIVFEVLPATTSADRSGNTGTFLRLAGGTNFTATQTWATLTLVYGGSSGAWCQIASSSENQ